ncbi:PREDICTED: UDP-N-acetylglucosamine diphosphorylase 2-like isoform X3 [Camelina sativa]|uniref:UDP-N-acetylglucosamine diphosphorylase n=1 Tax=Camelina sativa TaxID=90675 RepID=A0ABM1RN59_CAMSA|nr:PREDICTED: UDP-N-acetylglucosamine diphosphorylase 2-like isoform X5 [Camelina sativa]XP_019100447.1 PREDICTED: UDP-N-acetylglucosamine diphosphorylase 2-like isoform X3 [Camelina sativa]
MEEPTATEIEIGTSGVTTMPPPSLTTGSPHQALVERLKDYGQEDVFALWDELSPEERDLLLRDIENLDLPRIDRITRCSLHSQGLPVAATEPVPENCVSTVEERTKEDRDKWWRMGLKAIYEGKLGVVLLSGGQGTRLGSSDPKGCYNIGLPSGKSLFQIQAERILCVQRLAAQAMSEGSTRPVTIQWYIMTSPFTHEPTQKFFESRKYFGLEPEQVTFFQQGTLPCISKDGKFIMETPFSLAKAPDGNGGVYAALKSSRLLEDMASRGIKYVDCYGVDNVLVRVADPTFLGYFIDKGAASAAKVVRKAYPQEKVGVFVRRGKGGPLTVVEYTELDQSMASATNQQTGRLQFCWSNVCLHMFTLDFLNQVANGLEKDSVYHLAEKKIPSINGFTEGLKLEQFIFDCFPYAPSTALFEVLRDEEFAPVKNANGSNFDTPESARLLVLRLHTRWVIAAGGFLTHSVPLYATGVEVSPLCSYAGENLEAICRGRTFHAPCEISL